MKNHFSKLFVYTEPQNEEGFELLEKDDEKKPQSEMSGNISHVIRSWREKNRVEKNDNISNDLEDNIKRLEEEFNMPTNEDVVIRRFKVGKKYDACLVFIDGMIDPKTINDFILRELMKTEHFAGFQGDCPLKYIEESVLSVNNVTRSKSFEKTIQQILKGLSALFVQNSPECLLIESRGYEKRNVEKPITENVIRGSQEAFTENLRTNITLLRRIIKTKT